MSNFYERLEKYEDFYNDVRYWFEEWYEDLDESKKLDYFNKAMSNLGYTEEILYENTEEAINTLFDSPYQALVEQRNGDYSINDRYYSYPYLVSYSNVPYDEWIKEILDDMISNPTIYKVFIEHLYEDDND